MHQAAQEPAAPVVPSQDGLQQMFGLQPLLDQREKGSEIRRRSDADRRDRAHLDQLAHPLLDVADGVVAIFQFLQLLQNNPLYLSPPHTL